MLRLLQFVERVAPIDWSSKMHSWYETKEKR
jgi:hypothetical protein